MLTVIKKQLLIIGIFTLLICIEWSGCINTKNEKLTPAKIIIKNITYSPSNPVSNEEITFTITLENLGDRDDFSIIALNGKDRYIGNFTIQSPSFIIDGHSQKNVTISTAKHILNEGTQLFEIEITGNQTIQTILINIQPGPPEIAYAMTGYIDKNSSYFIEKTTFTAGEVADVYYRYINVNHEGEIRTYHNIRVYHEGILYYSNYSVYERSNDNKTIEANFPFPIERNWPVGEYQIKIEIQDKISYLNCTKTIYFTVV